MPRLFLLTLLRGVEGLRLSEVTEELGDKEEEGDCARPEGDNEVEDESEEEPRVDEKGVGEKDVSGVCKGAGPSSEAETRDNCSRLEPELEGGDGEGDTMGASDARCLCCDRRGNDRLPMMSDGDAATSKAGALLAPAATTAGIEAAASRKLSRMARRKELR